MHTGLHHAEKRKKEGNANSFDHVMIAVGLLAPLSLIPQVVKIWTERSAAGISLPSWILLGIVSLMWTIYGISRRSGALIVSNLLLALLDVVVVVEVLMLR